MTYALDTNILSYMLRRHAVVCDRLLTESVKGHECVIPPVAYYEIKRGLIAVNATAKDREFDNLCRGFEIGERIPARGWKPPGFTPRTDKRDARWMMPIC